jgi:uncharacterized membrane protein
MPLMSNVRHHRNCDMVTSASKGWFLSVGLIALCLVPAAAGILRVVQLSSGADISSENERFFAAPFPVVLHIASSLIYCILGAFQFNPSFRNNKPRWHRANGRLLIPCGLAAALTGLWMTQFYPSVTFDGPVLYAIRLLVGLAMILCLCLGFVAIRGRDVASHRAWMMRGYALGLGAGTQVLTHLPWLLLPSIRGELTRAALMAAGWAVNLAIAEWLIVRERSKRFHVA